MNSKDKSITIVVVLSVVAFFMAVVFTILSVFPHREWEGGLASPNLIQTLFAKPSPVPSPSPRLKTFKFDSGTDLKAELDSINPEVLDSDFNE